MREGRAAIYIDAPDEQFRWQLRRAALDERCTARELALRILSGWLTDHGYLPGSTDPKA
jgi:hypothetical protein